MIEKEDKAVLYDIIMNEGSPCKHCLKKKCSKTNYDECSTYLLYFNGYWNSL